MSTVVKFVSVPSKTLAVSINASAMTIQLSDIKGWDGANLAAANFGDVLWCVLRDSTNSFMEIMQLDPTTIASASVTVLKRGLDFSGGSVEVSANKLTWIKNDTIVELGSNPPQLLSQTVCVTGNQTISDLKTFVTLPQCTAVPTVPGDLVNKAYADGLVIAGALAASTTVQGYVQEATQAQADARTVTGSTGAKLFQNLSTVRSTKLSDYVASDTGSANAYAIATTPAITAYSAGQCFTFKAANANTASSTLAVSGLTAQTIKKLGSLNLSANDIVVGQIVQVLYDGTNFILMTPTAANTIPAGTIMTYAGPTAPTGWLICDGSAVSRTTYANLFGILNPTQGVVTITLASPGVVSLSAHGLATGDGVFLTTTGALPTGLSANTKYWVIKNDANSFWLATSLANALAATKINTSVSQSGVHTLFLTPYGVGDGSTTFNVPSTKGIILTGKDQSQTEFAGLGQTGGEKTHQLTAAEMPSHTHTYTLATPGAGPTAAQTGQGADTTSNTGSAGSDGAHNNLQPYLTVLHIIKV